MKRIVLISCVKKKLRRRAPAKDLYISTLFKFNLAYARTFEPHAVFVLSAKHGLIPLTKEIEPYELTLNTMRKPEVRAWADRVVEQLRQEVDLDRDHFILLAGDNYRKFVVPHMRSYEVPLEGLEFGKQLRRLKELLADASPTTEREKTRPNASTQEAAGGHEVCARLHKLAWRLPRHRFPFEGSSIPMNGIYLLFEHGEAGHRGDRIVRVGSHTGEGQLRSRLAQHFLVENKDRSIFRKNIGRALLAEDNDPFLESWELDLTARLSRDRHASSIDLAYQTKIEAAVSRYVRERFSFAAFEVVDKAERLALESRLISTVSLCKECRPSAAWLGLHSPKDKIRESGLWLVNHLYRKPATLSDLTAISSA